MLRNRRPFRGFIYPALLAIAFSSSGCAALVVGGAAGGAASSVEQSEEGHHGPMAYVGSVAASALYFPAKLLFAAGGAATSGVAYLVTLGDSSPSRGIWDASVNGDYVVTPRMIEGRDEVNFIGG